MWWHDWIVGLAVGGAAVYLAKLAGRTVINTMRGRGCGSGGCAGSSDQLSVAKPVVRELVHLNVETAENKPA